MTPQRAYTATLEFLRSAWSLGIDYEFQWGAPGVWIDAQEGLDWATEYVRLLRRHGIPHPNYWHIHSYRSPNKDRFLAGWEAWQEWYRTWGGNAPVVLSEVCSETGQGYAQRTIMDEARALLERGDVVGVFWFTTHPYNEWPCHLCEIKNGQMTLTPLGEHWISLK